MTEIKYFTDLLPSINDQNFEDIALELFNFQYKNNLLYQSYAQALGKVPQNVKKPGQIPFLPIRFYKSHPVISGTWASVTEFTSSSTTGLGVSKHKVWSKDFYQRNSTSIFEQFYGSINNFHFLALLPSYLERSGSSLISMIDHFINNDKSGHSGYYLNNHETLVEKIDFLQASSKKTLLWGVSFALLDLAEKGQFDFSNCIVMETGGMKGRRKEWIRKDLHDYLKAHFNVNAIHSEYGMTELFSQAYSKGDGYFSCPPWMKVVAREINDPFAYLAEGKTGAINVIDFANVHSCAFVETEDLGRVTDNSFEILGRMDNSDIRGCNLMVG